MGRRIMSQTYVIKDNLASYIFGVNDSNIPYIEKVLDSEINVRGNIVSTLNNNPNFEKLFSSLENESREKGELTESDIFMCFSSLSLNNEKEKDEALIVAGKSTWLKTKVQKLAIKAFRENQVVFLTGPSGTGKTFLVIAWALKRLLSGEKKKIIITRPIVESGENLGFLPGDLTQKIDPYLKPIYDNMEYFLSPNQIIRLEENGALEIAPLAYMRGRTLNNSIVILDEAQNTTKVQMKMFLTRLGQTSQALITGDLSQTDLRNKRDSGLKEALSVLNEINGIAMVKFKEEDTVRSSIVRDIIKAYEREGKNEIY